MGCLNDSSVQYGGINTLRAQKFKQEKLMKSTDFKLYQVLMYNFLCQTVQIFPIDYSQYIINIPNISFTKWIESSHFGLEISVL